MQTRSYIFATKRVLRESCGPRALRHVGGELVLVSGCALVAGLKPCLCQQRWYGEQVPHSLRDRV